MLVMNMLLEILFKPLKPEVGLINIYKLKSYITQNRIIFVITETNYSRCVENLSNIYIRTAINHNKFLLFSSI